MDILYIVGTGSKWDNNELRYSLRSIEKFGRNVGRVFIVGHKPSFVSDAVTHIPCDDPYNRKHKNILNKVITAIEKSDIGKHFIVSSDDHFYTREVDFDNFPVYYQASVIQTEPGEGKKRNNYHRSLEQTKEMLEKWGLPTFQTNPHCNTHFDADIYRLYYPLFAEAQEKEYGGEMNCLMGNILIHDGVQPVRFVDKKIGAFADTADLIKQIDGAECFSISDEAVLCGVGGYLQSLFPNQSKYEK